jgi:hypothetical protein
MTHNDEFDQILDDALAEYREAEPLTGLEDRVLQRLRLQAESHRKVWLRWSAIAAVAASLAIVAWIGLRDRSEVVAPSVVLKQSPSIEAQSRTAVIRAANEQPASKRLPRWNAVSQRAPLSAQAQPVGTEHAPMGEQFPSPAALQPEERMLLALAATHPGILMDKPDDDKEIVISLIDIKPLVETGEHQGEN